MKILFYKDLLIKFFVLQNLPDVYQKQMNKILYNENSEFIHSRKYLEHLKAEFGPGNENLYQAIALRLIDSNGQVTTLNNSPDFDSEFIQLNNLFVSKVLFKLAYNQTAFQLTNLAILTNQNKPNFDWLVVQLAISHPYKVTLTCDDFSSNQQVTEYFDTIFSIYERLSEVFIFNTHCNLDHDRLNSIIGKIVNYYTHYHRYDNLLNKRELIKTFGQRTKMYVALDNALAHGRRIVFENIIITPDNDFWNLDINASDWSIDVQYSQKDSTNWLSRRSNYRLVS